MEEKLGGVVRTQQYMDGFRDAINICGFKDLGYRGLDFTWCNNREGSNRIYMRLDRALATRISVITFLKHESITYLTPRRTIVLF